MPAHRKLPPLAVLLDLREEGLTLAQIGERYGASVGGVSNALRQAPPLSVAERFWAKVDKEWPTGCWVWTGHVAVNGYGRFGLNGEAVYAHRVAYELEVGPIPAGLQIDHLCRFRACVRPDHLEAVTQRTNILRGESVPAQRARATECVRGHEFTDANTTVNALGHRHCLTCRA